MSEISDLRPLTYSMLVNNIDAGSTKKNKSDYNYINLEKLSRNFELVESLKKDVLAWFKMSM